MATTIDKPTRAWEYDQIRWFLMHEHVTVGIDQDDDWLLEFATDCRHLRPNNRCAIYDTRPKLCRAYPGPDEQCEHDDIDQPAYKICFTNENQFNDYLRKKGKM